MKTGLKYKYALSLFFIGLISLVTFGGYLVGIHELPSYGFFRRVEFNVFGRYFERFNDPAEPDYYDSIFLRLYRTKTDISDRIVREGEGGGLTSFGDAVLLLTYDGQIFEIHSADDISDTKITVPDNGFAKHKRTASSEEFDQLTHNFRLHRYNDILFYHSGKNRGLAISYTDFDNTNKCYHNTVAVLPVEETIKSVEQITARAEDWDIIYRSKPCLTFKSNDYALDGGAAGGRMAFRPPSTILMGNGDYLWGKIDNPEAIAQDPESEYGKMMSIDLNSRESRIIASGIRNPQGIVFDKNDTLWFVEHGLRGGDELNRVVEGNNYGWPLESLGTQYSRLPIPYATEQTYGHHDNYTKPTFAWLPSVAISNLTLVEGFHNSWDGDLLMGSLKSRSLYHIRIKDNRVMFSEKIEIGDRIRYVHQHTDGRIVLWTDNEKLIFLTGKPYTDNYVADHLDEAITNETLRKRVQTAINACRVCHSIEPGEHSNAPSLASIFNENIGGTDYKNYSRALKEKEGNWTRENLEKFLKNPEQFAPGTVMPNPGINDNATLEEIINLLEALSESFPQ